MSDAFLSQSSALLGFLIRDGRVLRSAVVPLSILASAARTGMIYAVNEVAARGTLSWGLGLLLLAATALSLTAGHLARVKSYELVETLILSIRHSLADRLLAADVGFFQSRPHGEVFTALTSHAERVGEGIIQLARTLEALSLLLFCLIYMFVLAWPAGVATLVTLFLGVCFFFISDNAARKVLEAAHRARVAMHETVQDILGGYRELRLRTERRNAIEARAKTVTGEVKDAVVEAERLFSYGQLTASGALAGLLIAVVLILPPLADAGSVAVLQVLTVVLFSFGPIEVVIGNLPAFGRATVAYKRLQLVFEEAGANAEPASPPAAPPRAFDRLELRGITATLTRKTKAARDDFVLGPVDLTLTPGQSVFITGGNGTGKSTLLQILTGLRHADGGEIVLDGAPVDRGAMGPYRGLFSAVFSEFYLFRHLYGLSASERAALQGHIADLGLADGVSITDGAFESLALSTGQMRRLALSIALAEARPILILDEFAADQDPARRAFFYDVLVPRLAAAGHCVVAVTHDEHCFEKCDRLIRMEDGKIVSDTTQPARQDLSSL